MEWLTEALATRTAGGRLRVSRLVDSLDAVRVVVAGRELLSFCGNDYLGLRWDERVRSASAAAAVSFGAGSGASRLVSGNGRSIETLEGTLSDWLGCESALVFTSGYAANVGAISALMGPDDVVFSDALNHASLIDGCRLSRATVVRFEHLDLEALERALVAVACRGRRWIVVESIYSMDGDAAPLDALGVLADRFGALLYVDEAHALGVLGTGGRGVLPLARRVGAVICGTFGKALGSGGAFVAGPRVLRDYLWNCARSFVFSTGLTPPACGATLRSIELVSRETVRRARLRNNITQMRTGLLRQGVPCLGAYEAPIVPIVLGTEARALEVSDRLMKAGYFVQAIRPPTVPSGTARLRITLSSEHRPEQIDDFVACLTNAL